MKLSQNDIGGEILSIITKGMYSDPKDALREYVQNGVDAGSQRIEIKLRANILVVQDYGVGMTRGTMRRAVRVGMSDKNPRLSVGFMGIGLYSSYHLCDKLTVYSKVCEQTANQLIFDFKSMRLVLEAQKNKKIESEELNEETNDEVPLLLLLEDCIEFNSLTDDDYSIVGTRVEMSGVEENFFMSLSKFEEVSEYLEKVIPLPFHPEFSYGKEIQDHINEVCEKHGAAFKLINLNLDINGKKSDLHRPYKDSDFLPSKPLKPNYKLLSSDSEFFGVAWGCLNSNNSIITNDKVRGFLLRKQGFSLGARNNLLSIFTAKFFNRYVGEIIVVHPKLLPNGARNDFEYSNLRNSFYLELQNVAVEYNEDANKHQEKEKAEIELNKLIDLYRERRAQLRFFSDNSDKLLELYKELTIARTSFAKRKKVSWKIRDHIKAEAETTMTLMDELIEEVKGLIELKKEERKRKPATIESVSAKLIEA